MPKINLSTRYIKNICKIALKEDFYPSGDITSKLIKTNQIILSITLISAVINVIYFAQRVAINYGKNIK